MKKMIIATLLGLIIQGSSMIGTLAASQNEGSIQTKIHLECSDSHKHHCDFQGPTGPAGPQGIQGSGFQSFASYWLTNQPSLTEGQNVAFNLQQTLQGIEYDSTTGIFTVSPGVYVINFFGTPNSEFQNTLNLNINGTIIPTPSLEGSTIVVQFSQSTNEISLQATGNWSPQTGDIGSYFFAYASIAIYQIGSEVAP